MNNVVKLGGFDSLVQREFFKIDDGHFGPWGFDITVWDIQPDKYQLAALTDEQREAYEAGNLQRVKVRFTACLLDNDYNSEITNIWLDGLSVETGKELGESVPFIESWNGRRIQRGAINVSLAWIADSLRLIGITEASDEIERKLGIQ